MQEIFILVALVLGLIEAGLYWRGIRAGTFKPNAVTWTTWGTLIAITFAAQLHENAGHAAWLNAFYAAMYYCIAVFGLRYRRYNIVPADFIAFGGALAAIGLWLVTSNPFWSVLLVVVIDLCGLFPTFRKTWSQPFDEILAAYALGVGKYAFLLMALDVRNAVTMLHPMTIVIADSIFIAMALYRRRVLKG